MDEGSTGFPADKILCQGKYRRYVVACMKNCTEPHYCPEFWQFFERRGLTPSHYLKQNGIEENVMKRIVFDCDRCGKKDVGVPWSIFHVGGTEEGQRLQPAEWLEHVARAGDTGCTEGFLFGVLGLLHEEHKWEHFCDTCFRKIAGLSAQIVGKPVAKPAANVAVESAMTARARALAGEPKPAPRPEPKPEPKPVAKPEPKPVAKPAAKPVVKPAPELKPAPLLSSYPGASQKPAGKPAPAKKK